MSDKITLEKLGRQSIKDMKDEISDLKKEIEQLKEALKDSSLGYMQIDMINKRRTDLPLEAKHDMGDMAIVWYSRIVNNDLLKDKE